MKIAVSIPDPLFRDAETLSKELGVSRSALYADALTAYLKQKKSAEITARINASLEATSQEVDPFIQEAARRTLERGEW